MKRLCISFLSLLLLSGCNEEKKIDNAELMNQNRISIKGEGISEIVDLDNVEYDFIAHDNNSSLHISFNSKGGEPIQYGSINLDQVTKKVSLNTLIRNTDGILCTPLFTCFKNTTYNIESKNGLNFININFNNAPNFFLNSDKEINMEELAKNPVVVNGRLLANAPMNWPVFQSQRFPIYNTDGSLEIDGKAYEVSYIDLPSFQYENDVLERELIGIHLKSNVDTIILAIEKRFDIAPQYNNVFLHLYYNDFSSVSLPISNDSWQDNGNLIYLDLINVGLVDHNSGEIKNLNANIKMPRSNAKLTLNENTLEIMPVGSSFEARVANDRKSYYLDITGNDKYSQLEIIHELKGHVSLKFFDDGIENATCGDRNSHCDGLTYNEQLQTFTFKNVKLGVESLNGTVFVAGVKR